MQLLFTSYIYSCPELNSNIEEIGDWTVVKLPSGIAMATLMENKGSIALNTKVMDGVYTHTSVHSANIPLPTGVFKEIIGESMNIRSNGYTLCQISHIDVKTLNYRIWSPYATTVDSAIATWIVIGKWK